MYPDHTPEYHDYLADQLEAECDKISSAQAKHWFSHMAGFHREAAKHLRRVDAILQASKDVLGKPQEYRSRMVN